MRARLEPIDGLRGLAILAVIYQHAYAARLTQWIGSHGYTPFLLGDAWTGVSLFFLLSGFVLTIPFVGRERVLLQPQSIKAFLVRRAWRLLPLFIFVSVIGFALFQPSGNLGPLLLTVTTMHMLVPSQFYPLVNGPFWSLSVEIWASVALPFLILLAGRIGYFRLFVLVSVMSLAVRICGVSFGFSPQQELVFRDSVFGRLDDFAAGAFLASLFVGGQLRSGRHWLLGAALAALVLGCFCNDVVVFKSAPRALLAFMNIPITAGFFALTAYSLSEANRIRRVLSIWPLQICGLMCFSLYSWHNIFISAMHRDGTLAGEFGFWLVLVTVAGFTFSYVEFPSVPAFKLFYLGPRVTKDANAQSGASFIKP